MTEVAKTPQFYNVPIASADTEYTFNLPAGTKQFSVWTNTTTAALRLAYESGAVATPTEPYYNLIGGLVFRENDLHLLKDWTLYIASDTGSISANVEVWV